MCSSDIWLGHFNVLYIAFINKLKLINYLYGTNKTFDKKVNIRMIDKQSKL